MVCPLATFHTLAVLSLLPVTSCLPSGLNGRLLKLFQTFHRSCDLEFKSLPGCNDKVLISKRERMGSILTIYQAYQKYIMDIFSSTASGLRQKQLCGVPSSY
jgi:hypothetical protein